MPAGRRIFLAHASEDKEPVRRLYHDLKARGLEPWLDEMDLVPGQVWKTEIPKAIREAGVFLACLSTRSVKKVGYVQNEFRTALSAYGERPPEAIFLIPVRLDACEIPDLQIPDRGLSLRDIHWLNLDGDDGLDRLVHAIHLALGEAEAPAESVTEIPGPAPETGVIDEAIVARAEQTPRPAAPPEPQPIKRTSRRGAIRPPRRWPWLVLVFFAVVEAGAGLLRLGGDPVEWIQAFIPELAPVAEVEPGETFRDCAECPEMVVVPAGSFLMGSPEVEKGRDDDEGPQHEVTFNQPLAIGKYEVTFEQWDACVEGGGCNGYRPEDKGWGRGNRPVINVSWEHAQAFVAWLSEVTGETYRLPTEAEWEYAARAGTTTRYAFGDEITPAQANYYGGNIGKTTPVGSYNPNGWGLTDGHLEE